ncbi:hypothetical protein QBC40DRAFT_94296 [Triangularia verruculosa]|uniref:Uncharacterized protein n=1 Tax=Triangularia verruculosa TaxID=2587418 RepID=A0AAN7AT46_9PEZI|nr:hypothetical protein QBC40DRAFT_94296 [Triangularia verruculosa]
MNCPNPALRTSLLDVLGCQDVDGTTCSPYLDYIEASWPGRGMKDDYIRFVIEVVTAFGNAPYPSVQEYINGLIAVSGHYFFDDTLPNSPSRATAVKDIVLIILGVWLLMEPYTTPARNDQRCILEAYCVRQKTHYSEDTTLCNHLPDLVAKSGLLPNPQEVTLSNSSLSLADTTPRPETSHHLHAYFGMQESLSITPKRLNAVKLSTLGGVKFTWTNNISRHLLLTRHAGERHTLELFALPCALQGGNNNALINTGIISAELVDEIEASYAVLFNPVKASYLHRTIGRWALGLRYWCWCLDCSSHQLRKTTLEALKRRQNRTNRAGQYDPRLETLLEGGHAAEWQSEWDQTEFKSLWPRILALDAHLEGSKPWSFWVIFRDRRDTLQYWTFLFGSIILILTVVQVILGAAQVAGSFAPVAGD